MGNDVRARLGEDEREALVDLLDACPDCGCSVGTHDMRGVGCLRSSCTCPLDRETATLAAFDAARAAAPDGLREMGDDVRAQLGEDERRLIQIEVAALRAGHVHMRDVFGVVERILAARAAAPDGLREAVEGLAAEFDSEVDWSSGRWDYGDNQAWESATRRLREVLAAHPAPGGGA